MRSGFPNQSTTPTIQGAPTPETTMIFHSRFTLIVALYGVGLVIATVIILVRDSPFAAVITVASGIILDDLRELFGEERRLGASKKRRRRACARKRPA